MITKNTIKFKNPTAEFHYHDFTPEHLGQLIDLPLSTGQSKPKTSSKKLNEGLRIKKKWGLGKKALSTISAILNVVSRDYGQRCIITK